jgi:undecaprenyl-diphosphatase
MRRIRVWVAAFVIIALVLAIAFWLDPFVQNWIVQHPNRQLRLLMGDISRFGDWPEHVGLGLLLLGIAWWRGSKKWVRVFLAMLIACALAGVAARVVKIAAGRARPSVKTEVVWNGPRLSEKYHAFPSGHTAASTAFFAVLVIASWRIGFPCLLIPLLIALSRMYVAAHYLSDVVFAAILGAVCALIVARIMKITPDRSD